MRRAPSALAAIGGFGIAVATMSVATTAAIVLLAPDPPALQITVGEAMGALRGGVTSLVRERGEPPVGTRAPFIEGLLAAELGVPAGGVRAVWFDPPVPSARTMTITAARARVSLPMPSFILRPRGGGGLEMVAPSPTDPSLRWALLVQPQPAFAAGVRGNDGRWTTVAPHRPFVSGWRLRVIAALGLSLLLLAPLAWLFARRLTRPFRALADGIDGLDDHRMMGGPRELRDAAAAIARFRDGLANQAQERARMLTAVAHDLRTPLTSLRLRIESAPEPQRQRMAADAERMQQMIREVLDYARVADAPRQAVAARAVLGKIAEDMSTAAGALGLEPGADITLDVNETAFRRAVENLAQNAIDYAGGGRIALRRDGDNAVVAVTDSGVGIALHDRDRLARPFERGDISRNRETGGMGLGLSIVDNFAKANGGYLTLDDAPDGGLIASLSLPIARSASPIA